MDQQSGETRPGRLLLRVVVFLLGFALLLVVIEHVYLWPAAEAAKDADPRHRRELAALSWLVLALVLFVLLVSLFLIFRISRFFFPRPRALRIRTAYVDAWGEAAKRMKDPPAD